MYSFYICVIDICLNLFYICGGNAMVRGGVWKVSRQSLFFFVSYSITVIGLFGLLLVCCSESCRQCDGVCQGYQGYQGGSLHSTFVVTTVVVCWLLLFVSLYMSAV